MNRLAKWEGLQIAAVLMLLLWRPFTVFFNAEFLSSQSSSQAQIAFIEDDIAIQRLAVCRRMAVPAPIHRVVVDPPIVPPSIAITAPGHSFFDDSAPVSLRYTAGLARTFSGRSPPFALL